MKKNSIFRWGVAMLLLFTGLSLRAYAKTTEAPLSGKTTMWT